VDVLNCNAVDENFAFVYREIRSVGNWKVECEPSTHFIILDGLVDHSTRAVVKKVAQHDEQVCESMTLGWYEDVGHLILYASARFNI
jgi:hypothetical protein